MYELVDIIRSIKMADKKDIDETIFPEKLNDMITNKFVLTRWYKGSSEGASRKYEYKTFIDDISNERKGQNIRNALKVLSSITTRLIDFVEENIALIRKAEDGEVYDENFVDLEEETDQRKRAEMERERESRRQVAQQQRIQEAREERELEQEQEEAGQDSEEGRNLIGSMVEDAGIEMEEYENLQKNQNLLESLVEVLEDMDKIDDLNSLIITGISAIENTIVRFQEKITSPAFQKKLKRFTNLFEDLSTPDFDTDSFLEQIEGLDEENVEEEKRIAIKEYTITLKSNWNSTITQSDENVLDKQNLLNIIPALKLEEGIAVDMATDEVFNDGRLGGILLSSDKLILTLDYVNRVAKLKGNINWESKRVSTISYKMAGKGNIFPKYTGASGETLTQRKLRGKRMTPGGLVQQTDFRASPVDKLRLEFLNEVKSNIQILQGVINQ